MHTNNKNVLLLSMPFSGILIPSIQLPTLEGYLKERDINIKTKHLYLKAAEFYGLQNYEFLIYPPNEPYTAQMIFSKYVFPDHWIKTEDKFREYFNKNISKNEIIQQDFSFQKYIELTDKFYNWVINNVDWKSFDIIGFTLNYGQLLPSLAIAKKIKSLNPEKKIVLGGSRTVNYLGKKILEVFDYIDFIVYSEGEEALYQLAKENPDNRSIPNLIYRSKKYVLWNNLDYYIDLSKTPIPSYDQFYKELSSTSKEIEEVFYRNGRLPIEISRGCWWNKCSFCNQKIIQPFYKEKNVDRFIEEIQWLSGRYKVLDFQLIGSTLPKNHRLFLNRIIELKKDFTFVAEARAAQLVSNDYTLLKNAGFSIIQTGIESFSKNYLKKMNKGVRVIDNIAAIKFCKENKIINPYNLIVDYPNEEMIDFEETKRNIDFFKSYLDPPQICYLRVLFGSTIHCNPSQYNIKQFEYDSIDKIMYPKEFLEKGFNLIYGFKRKQEVNNYEWERLVDDWKKKRKYLEIEGIKKQTLLDKLVCYFVDGGNFIKIYDKRNIENIKIYILDETERDIFLSCIDIISYDDLKERLPDVPEYKLIEILKTFKKIGIIFQEDNFFLSLPLRCKTKIFNKPIKEDYILVSD